MTARSTQGIFPKEKRFKKLQFTLATGNIA